VKSIEGRVKVAEEGVALIRRVPEGIRRNFYVKVLAEKVDIQETMVYDMLQSSPKDRVKAREPLMKKPPEEKTFPRPEEMIVRLMVQQPHLIPRVSEQGIVREFESPFLRRMAEDLQTFYEKKGRLDLAEALGGVAEDLKGGMCSFVFKETGLEGGDLDKVLEECIQMIRERSLRRDKRELLGRIKEAERQKGEKGLEALLLERQELAKKESNLRKMGDKNG
jgi:DNA primase